ncbi:DNA-dependent ATPase protein rad54 [Xylographa bjoerkii]|nr:DNA-dependent ATPase protein rad54 [Xylographa bjoerkii]
MIIRASPFALGAYLLLINPLAFCLSPSDIPSDTPISSLVSSAKANLAQGKSNDALTYFDVAVSRDPKNYLTIFQRGATYLSLGKNAQAQADFDRVLLIRPDFEGALLQRAKIKSKNADWEAAKSDYRAARKTESVEYTQLDEAQTAASLAVDTARAGDWEACVSHAGAAIMIASSALALRQLRANCRFERGEVLEGASDLQHVLQLSPRSIEPHLQISSMLFYSIGDTEKGLAQVRKCLHSDPDSKACSKLYKREKQVDKLLKQVHDLKGKRQFSSAVKVLVGAADDTGLIDMTKEYIQEAKAAGTIHKNSPNELYAGIVETTCEIYVEMNNKKKALSYCEEALNLNTKSLPGLLFKAQRQLDDSDFEPAIQTLNHAKEHHGNNQQVQTLLQKAHTLLKRSKTKDYYKVLGVANDADDRTIKKAYRALVKQFHPDKASAQGVGKEASEKKMASINEAYEVLSDPELRERFDRGDDPNSQEHQGSPFQGSPFGQGPGGQQFFFKQSSGGGGGGFQHRPKALTESADKENTPVPHKASRLYGGGPQSVDRLIRPFKCPGTLTPTRASEKPARKRRKISYADADGSVEDDEKPWSNEDRLALANRDANRFPVYKVKDKETQFRQRFSVPLINKEVGGYNPFRPAPTLGMRTGAVFVAKPLHDPSGEFAIVLYDPTIDNKPVSSDGAEKEEEEKKPKLDVPLMHKSLADILGLKKQVDDHPKIPVVIDPRLAKVLRPHQVEGVKFLYRCTTGLIDEKANGCIMADEMGLGKTLQCITLMWTLLKQSPNAGKSTIQKCVIACPSSLVRNWANELVKWLGPDAVTPFAVDGKASKAELTSQLRQWAIASGRAVIRPVLIVSYETLRLNVDELKDTPIGLMLCDEGHRLKNGDSQTFTALNGLNVDRRVILSGTPIQNDLTEYFSLLNFANPNLLGTRMEFRKKYEIPILRGRDAAGTDTDRKKGDECLAELLTLVNKFIIRRTNDILSKYLPVKYEHVVFCNLAPFQKDLYNFFIQSPDIKSLLRGKGSQPLKAIGMLKKLCNHPDLLDLSTDLPGSDHLFPADYVPKDARGRDRDVKPWYSGKMAVLDRMLARIRQDTNDKIVLISNYTQTLDIFDKLCRARNYGVLRLDGTMNVNKRQKLVDRFNDPEGAEFVFLLSSKAGGCGLNLIGANRLVLFDPDWNPAADQQALARVWRDGQKKDCFVYRFIATGTIEEKIFQRQSHKQSLSSCVVDSAEDVERHFSIDSLRELFQFKPDTTSDTHDTFKCKRCKPDGRQWMKAPAMLYGDTSSWNHFVDEGEGGPLAKIQDLLLRQEVGSGAVSAVFQYISH